MGRVVLMKVDFAFALWEDGGEIGRGLVGVGVCFLLGV